MVKNISKKIVFFLMGILVFSVCGNAVLAKNEKVINLPNFQEVKKKKNFSKLKGISENAKSIDNGKRIINKNENDNIANYDINSYLNKLTPSELLITVAETSEELVNKNSYSEISAFEGSIREKLIPILQENSYRDILDNKEYSGAFKGAIVDIYAYSKKISNQRNSKEINNQLRRLISEKSSTDFLKLVCINNIDDFNEGDTEFLDSILKNHSSEDLKLAALKCLKISNAKEFEKTSNNIINNANKFSDKELIVAMKLMVRLSNEQSPRTIDQNELVDSITKILKTTKSDYTIKGCVYALSEIKTKKSIEAIITNKSKINNENLIGYYINKNYLAIDALLDKQSDTNSLELAFKCIEIRPFKSFITKLQKLLKENEDPKLYTKVTALLNQINNNQFERNTSWD